MEYDDEDDEVGYSSAQEYAEAFPEKRFVITYVAKTSLNALRHQRVTQFVENVAVAGKIIARLQADGIDTVQMFKLEPYSLSKALAVHDKKQRRATRKESKEE
jgi:hypothetical protein